jgi:hypothetical protein
MKKFSEMTQSEIDSLSDVEYKSISPFDKKSCYDCGHLKQGLSWWCGNKEAIEKRGTSIPGCIKCPFWKPQWNLISDEYKTEENGYIKPIEIKVNKVKVEYTKWYIKLFKFFLK